MQSKDGLQHEIVADIKRVASDLGRTPNRAQYRDAGKFSDRQVRNAFGGFSVAMKAAGLEPIQDRASKCPAESKFERAVEKYDKKTLIFKHFEQEIAPWVGAFDRKHSGIHQLMVCGDLHSQYLDQWCWEVFIAEATRRQPEYINLNGDVAEFWEISKYDRNPRRILSLQSEIDYITAKILRPLREACPNSQIDWTLGNHERRLFHFLSTEGRGLSSLRALRFDELFPLKELQIGLVARPDFLTGTDKKTDNWKRYGPVTVTHGTRTGSQPASAEFAKFGTSGISNHVHRSTTLKKKNLHGYHQWISNGRMCVDEVTHEYEPSLIDHNSGFAIAHIDGEHVFMEPIDLTNPIACIGGVYYRRKLP